MVCIGALMGYGMRTVRWSEVNANGEWVTGFSAMGCPDVPSRLDGRGDGCLWVRSPSCTGVTYQGCRVGTIPCEHGCTRSHGKASGCSDGGAFQVEAGGQDLILTVPGCAVDRTLSEVR